MSFTNLRDLDWKNNYTPGPKNNFQFRATIGLNYLHEKPNLQSDLCSRINRTKHKKEESFTGIYCVDIMI